jgi:hypothetical protein
MGLSEALALSLKVLADWRVIFIAAAFLILMAALRYAGSVYRSAAEPRRRRPAPLLKKSPASGRRAAARAPVEEEGMIE